MKIKATEPILFDHRRREPGDEFEVDDPIGQRLINKGKAEEVKKPRESKEISPLPDITAPKTPRSKKGSPTPDSPLPDLTTPLTETTEEPPSAPGA